MSRLSRCGSIVVLLLVQVAARANGNGHAGRASQRGGLRRHRRPRARGPARGCCSTIPSRSAARCSTFSSDRTSAPRSSI